MKLIYSELQKLIPSLDKKLEILRDDLTLIGHFINFYEEIEDEIVFDLDIKVNRGDCLGYYGLARDLSVYYNLPLVSTQFSIHTLESKLPIEIKTTDVLRIQAIKISNLKNSISPTWLSKFLRLHNINSINTVVDLTNYIMLLYGIPCHAFDTAKIDQLIWHNNPISQSFTTLDGTILKLNPDCLLISDSTKPVSMSFVGGQNSSIELSTTETILEMAIYNPIRVRQDWRELKTVTEAAIRLEKNLDPDSIPLAFSHLIKLICELTNSQITSHLFDYYPNPLKPQSIPFNPNSPSQVSGITIPTSFALDSLKRLGCTIDGNNVTPPTIRKDISAPEDLIEEVVRFYGYQNIPTSFPIANQEYPDITPNILYLIEKLKDELVTLGYDEVRTWPLIKIDQKIGDMSKKDYIITQNSLNDDYFALRQSLIESLQIQESVYGRFKINATKFFEIGKIFHQEGSKFIEQYSLAVYTNKPKDLDILSQQVDIKLNWVNYKNYYEAILPENIKINPHNPKGTVSHAYEVTSQLIDLDATLVFTRPQDNQKLIDSYKHKIEPQYLWSLVIKDYYLDPKTQEHKYTLTAVYFNCDSVKAKENHSQIFNS